MLIMQVDELKKSYGEKQLFNNISFSIQDTDKIGLIGVNGTGKTSLLNAISGVEPPDSGTITVPKGVKISYLTQNPEFDSELTVLEAIFQGSSNLIGLIRDYENALTHMELDPKNEKLQNKVLALQHRMDMENAWEVENQVKTILTQLKITDFDAVMGTLSGGQIKRVALAEALISDCQLLILDEPTNHMDSETVSWLETILKARRGALIMVTHDRYFLDRVVNKTIELDKGEIYTYTGNYTEFVEKKAERKMLESSGQRKLASLYKKELEWIRKGAKARTTKQKARIDRFDNIKGGIKNLDEEKVEISVAHSRLGSKIIEINSLSKSFGDLKILKDFSYTMIKSDRIGMIGPSGIGKTTLLRLITGELLPDSGEVILGSTVKIGYFSQDVKAMDENLRAIEWIKQTADCVTTDDGETISASQMMERFLFDGQMQYTYISRLSGGERRRLYLLQVLMGCPNVLILDEPTNDLDIDTLSILEDYLDEFRGAVIIISHDRYFLDRTCESIWAFLGDGKVLEHTGNYSDYIEFIEAKKEMEAFEDIKSSKSGSKPSTSASKKVPEAAPAKPAEKKKLTFNEIHESKTIDSVVSDLEKKLENIENEIKASSSDFEKLTSLLEEKDEVEVELLEKMERQEYLHLWGQ